MAVRVGTDVIEIERIRRALERLGFRDRCFTPDEQEFKCLLLPEAFAPVPNAWGRQGWTTATLAGLSAAELTDALETAWRHAVPKRPPRR